MFTRSPLVIWVASNVLENMPSLTFLVILNILIIKVIVFSSWYYSPSVFILLETSELLFLKLLSLGVSVVE